VLRVNDACSTTTMVHPRSLGSRAYPGFDIRLGAAFRVPVHLSQMRMYRHMCWLRGTVVERRSLAGELSLSHARPAHDR